MFLSRNTAKRWTMLLLAVVILVVTAEAAKASSANVPIQPQFLSAPLSFDWNSTLNYRIKLVSHAMQAKTARLTFLPYVQLMPGAQGKNGKGGVASYQRRYRVEAGQSRSFSFRLQTYDPSSDVFWCLRVYLEVPGAAPQSIDTCAVPTHK
jgi:hypothetical protein